MDSFYDYIWDVTILEYLTRILSEAPLSLAVLWGPNICILFYFLNKLKWNVCIH